MSLKKIQAIFIDRDGTIGGTGGFIHPKDFQLYSFSPRALKLLKERGFKIFALTNQHRISRNEATIEEFIQQFQEYGFDDAFICPHEENENCNCRKPKGGMLLSAAKKYNLDLEKCIVVGDVGNVDMVLADKFNCIKVMVKTGWGENSLGEYKYLWKDVEPDYIAGNLLQATNWILENCESDKKSK